MFKLRLILALTLALVSTKRWGPEGHQGDRVRHPPECRCRCSPEWLCGGVRRACFW